MINAEQQRDWLQNLLVQADTGQAVNDDWFQQARVTARQAIATLPPITNKQEAWRYSRIDKLFEQEFQVATQDSSTKQKIDIHAYLIPDFDSYRLVMLDGHFQSQLSSNDLPAGVSLGSLKQFLNNQPKLFDDGFAKIEQHAEHLFTALNTALINDGVVVYVEKDVQLDKPIEVIYLNTQSGVLSQTRNLILLGEHAKATILERFFSSGQTKYFQNSLTDIQLAEAASLTHYRLQDESRDAYHLSSIYLAQNKKSHYTSTSLAFGAAWARTDLNVSLQQEYADCELNGLYTVGEKQLNDFHLDVQHKVPFCTSREQFKGILYGKGRAIFDGHILVEKQAQKSDAQLTNDNLMLTRDAEVDTKPQLEIYADDVKCSHGTTVGQLDEQQVFYMRSRGISESAARRMLCIGFASEVIDTIDNDVLRNYAAEKLAFTLNEAVEAMEHTHGYKENVLS
ncbi:MAG TPA: Fe-S cluster assembly protein SufD [Gammaproteobacteria bacterium]